MDVVIKSFNRPCYLDRCLCSIKHHVRGVQSIRVLDDGTPAVFLEEIKRRHPEVQIICSALYAKKSHYVEQYSSNISAAPEEMSAIPWDLWRSTILGVSKRFFLLEDDQWCVKPIDFRIISGVMESNSCALVRLSQTKCPAFDAGVVSRLSSEVYRVNPWYLKNRMRSMFYYHYTRNTCRMQGMLRRLGVSTEEWRLNAYAVYVVCGAIFDRDYWLDVICEAGSQVDEQRQLIRALRWAKSHKDATFARMESDCIMTTFRSSASSRKIDESVGFDMMLFNNILNKLWLAGEIDPSAGMPGDFPVDLMLSVLVNAREARCAPERWSDWCCKFAEPFKRIGCTVE
jgi:hypothetical protein